MINSPIRFCRHMLLQKFSFCSTTYTGTFRLDVFQGNFPVFYQVNVFFSLFLRNTVTIIQIFEITGFNLPMQIGVGIDRSTSFNLLR